MDNEQEVFERILQEAANDPVNRIYLQLGEGVLEAPDIRAAMAARDPDERAFLALVMCGAEIDNGGFEQLFSNSSNEIAEHGAEGAEHFGLPEHAAIIRSALDRWAELADMTLEGQDERLDELDEEWFSRDQELQARLLDFATQRES